MNLLQRAARRVNRVTTPLVRLPLLRPLLGRSTRDSRGAVTVRIALDHD